MTRPDPNPETGGRPLAEILREAGIDMSRQARRRRWNDPEWEDPVPQRRGGPDTDAEGSANFGRRRSDQSPLETPGRGMRASREPEPSTAAIPGVRPERKPRVPASAPTPTPPPAPPPAPLTSHTGPVGPRSGSGGGHTGRTRLREPEPEPATPVRGGARTAQRPPARLREEPSTGPIPIATADLDAEEEVGGRESALAWLRFGGELLIALAVGVGVYFAFNVLWEILPYVAVLAAPVVVAGLVAGVGVWRARMGREHMGVRLLATLVFAGTLLAIAPAAGLLSGS